MTDDIVKALRELDADKPDPWGVCYEAADEIKRLRALLELSRPYVGQADGLLADRIDAALKGDGNE